MSPIAFHPILPIPIKSDTSFEGAAFNIAVATKIVDATLMPVGTTAIQLQAGGANTQRMFFADDAANATLGNAYWELDAGQSQYLDLGAANISDVWASPASGTQRVRVLYIKGGV